ncbi:formimidoylglutamase [Maricaulaceae bacterium NA33B04]|nr:formimidoylglutamase [Maricaulaceae bacterium NA33B04]
MPVSHLPADPWTGRSDPEDGPGALRLHHLVGPVAHRGLMGFACDAGVARNKGRIGAKDAPDAIRKAMANLSADDQATVFTDLGTVAVEGDDLEAGQALLTQSLQEPLSQMKRVLVLGGGHETAFASYSALAQAFADHSIGIINLDAHLDLRAVGEAGPSSGTPFHQIRALNPDRFDYLCLGMAEESNTTAIKDRARDWGVQIVSDRQVNADITTGLEAISDLIARNDLVYLTIDMDVLPHFAAPGVSAPAARGVALEHVEAFIDHVLAEVQAGKAALPLADIVEVNPRFDQDGATARTAAVLARTLLLS